MGFKIKINEKQRRENQTAGISLKVAGVRDKGVFAGEDCSGLS